jgi:hypothetical protein
MKKVVRLTETDLMRIVKKVINEQQSGQNNNKILETFLNKIDMGQNNWYSKWVLDPNNPNKRNGNVQLTGREATIRTNFVNKPLVWSLMVNGKKEKNSIFEIFKIKEKLYYQCITMGSNDINPVMEYGKELGPNLNSAIQQFNQNVLLQNTN